VVGTVLAAVAGVASSVAWADGKVETYVGTWSGKVTSKGCTSDATAKIELEVALTSGGGLRSSGDVLEDGLGDLDWTIGKSGLSASRTGLTGSLAIKGNAAKLSVKTDGGCSIKGTLKRATSGIADCDRLLALATIASQCTALPSETRGKSLSDARGAWSGWQKLKGKKKTAQGAQCRADADALASQVTSCASGGAAVLTGIPMCDEYVRLMQSYLRCDKVPQAARDAAKQGLDAMTEAWGQMSGMPDDAKQAANEACQQAGDALKQGAAAMGCSL
jgi:hypothetical protein